jgi:hypothetical protein
MSRIFVMGLASLAVVASVAATSAQQAGTPSTGSPAVKTEPPPPAEKSQPLAGPETGTRHPSAGTPDTGYHGSSDPESSVGANLPGQNVQPNSGTGSGSGTPPVQDPKPTR